MSLNNYVIYYLFLGSSLLNLYFRISLIIIVANNGDDNSAVSDILKVR